VHIKHLYEYKTVKQFKEDLDFLLKNYTPINLHDILYALKESSPFPDNSFFLTFDDGFREMSEVVAPILLQKGISATFFINSAFVDNKNLSHDQKTSLILDGLSTTNSLSVKSEALNILSQNRYTSENICHSDFLINHCNARLLDELAGPLDIDFSEYLAVHRPYLTSKQIMAMIDSGFNFGAHSIDHPIYQSIPLEQQLHQTIESVKEIRERFCLDYGVFAFPYSDKNVSKAFFSSIYSSGFVDVSFGNSGMIDDSISMNLQRFSLEKPLMPAERLIGLQFTKRLFKLVTGSRQIIRE